MTLIVFRDNYFDGEPIMRTERGVREGKLRKGKAAGKDEVTGEMVNVRGELFVE